MHFIAENLKKLRKDNQLTQGEFAHILGVKRSMIGAYEEGRADPRISFLQLVCQKYGLGLDDFINAPLTDLNEGQSKSKAKAITGSALRVLSIAVDSSSDTEKATLVPVKAAAGYLNGFGDVEFIETLPTFSLPFPELPKGKTYRLFQIKGDSMLPIESGSYIISTYVMDWNDVKNDSCYVFITKSEGIVFKRALNNLRQQKFTLKSDNPTYEPFDLDVSDIMEIWKAEGVTRIGLADSISQSNSTIEALTLVNDRLDRIERKLEKQNE